MSTEALLAERRKTHGDYREHAAITQQTLQLWMGTPNWSKLTDCQRETLHMEAHKIGRILTGDPNVKDHWDDMAGYATLISQQLGESDEKRRAYEQAPLGGTFTYKPDPAVAVSVTNTDTAHDRYRRYANGARTDPRLLTFQEWLERERRNELLRMVPRNATPVEDSNKHAFQSEEDGA